MRWNKAFYYMALGCFLYLGACSNPNIKIDKENKAALHTYFDIPLFFQQEAQRLGTQKVQKNIQYADKSESKLVVFSTPEQWEKEFALFSQVQLNTSSLTDAYLIDTLNDANDSLHYTVRYTAKNPEKLYAQSVDIYLQKPNAVKSIGLVLLNDNILAPTHYFLQYQVDAAYSILVTKQMPFDSLSQIQISALFLPQ